MTNSYNTINKMFFLPVNDIETDIILDLLNKHMLTKSQYVVETPETQLIHLTTNQTKNENIHENLSILTQNIPTPVEYISPIHHDTLFWCIYIAIHGYNDYQQLSRNYSVKELEIKQKIGNYIQNNPSKMKNTNMKITSHQNLE